MGRTGFLIGQVVARSGLSRKALRLYEAVGILPPPARTAAGYRLYDGRTLEVLAFLRRARALGLSLTEIREIVAIRRAGRAPCPHVRALVERKVAQLDRGLAELGAVRARLKQLLRSWEQHRSPRAAVCAHIEAVKGENTRRSGHGTRESIPLPGLRGLSGSRDRRR